MLSGKVISDRYLQFTVWLIKELNEILGIEIKLSTTFYSQIDKQTKRTNQKFLKIYNNHRQGN